MIAIYPRLKAHVRYRFPQFGYAAADNNRLINILRLTFHICFIFGIRIIFQFQPPAVALQYIAALIGNSCLYDLRFRGIQFKDTLFQSLAQFHRIIRILLFGIQHILCIIAEKPTCIILNIRHHQLSALLSQQE